MLEQLAAAAAAAILSTGSAAAMAAARRASETRDAVLLMRSQIAALHERLDQQIGDQRNNCGTLAKRISGIEQRVAALENGWISSNLNR